MSGIPAYPVVHVTVDGDGTCRVNVGGTHLNFDSDDAENNRNQVTGYAADLARELGRPVRMQIIDSDTEWLVAVHPDGAVTEIPGDNAPRRIRLPRRPPRGPATADLTDVVTAPPAEPATPIPAAPRPAPISDDLEHTRLVPSRREQRKPERLATLRFSDGSTAAITGSALIGRRPEADPGELVDTTIALQDDTRRLSRSHLRLEWRGSAFVALDRDSANGTYLRRGTDPTAELPSMIPVELVDGDQLELGTPALTIHVTLPPAERNAE